MQSVLDKVWTHLLPAMRPRELPADPHAYDALRDKLAGLSLPLPNGRPSSPRAEQQSEKTYTLDDNALKLECVAIAFGDDRGTLVVRDARGEHPAQFGYGTWLTGISDVHGGRDQPVAACGAWSADDTFEIRACFTEGEFCPVLRFHYASGDLRLEVEPNVAWGPTTVTTITGRLAG
jgi:hypothetical protein